MKPALKPVFSRCVGKLPFYNITILLIEGNAIHFIS